MTFFVNEAPETCQLFPDVLTSENERTSGNETNIDRVTIREQMASKISNKMNTSLVCEQELNFAILGESLFFQMLQHVTQPKS